MTEQTIRSRFDAISPLDYRFYGGDAKLYAELHPYLSEEAAIRYKARVEGALAQAMAKQGLCSERIATSIEQACREIVPAEVAEEETRTRHDVRALVNVIRSRVSDEAKPCAAKAGPMQPSISSLSGLTRAIGFPEHKGGVTGAPHP